MIHFAPNHYKRFMKPRFLLNNVELEYVEQSKYLGHLICSDLSADVKDIEKCKSAMYMRGNMLIRKFSKCSDIVKIMLF